jgi:HJR/Mrr/RecB family endonuclease
MKHTPSVIVSELDKINFHDIYFFYDKYNVDSIDSVINTCISVHSVRDFDTYDLSTDDPYEYEHLVANQLCSLGWEAYPTSGSGDQGADVVAEKHGLKFVIQCKLYSQPVGNKAVQEVTSARDFYRAFGALVVTNNDYTKSARQLAESQSVWLLHDSQLGEWDEMIKQMFEEATNGD